AAEVLLPVRVRVDLVDEHSTLLAAVAIKIALPVAVDVEPADHAGAGHRSLPNAGVDDPALPLDILRHPDVDGQEHGHQLTPFVPAGRAAVARPRITPMLPRVRTLVDRICQRLPGE